MTDFNSQLGLRPGTEPASVTLEPRPEHQAAPGMVHFAVLATMAEVAASLSVGASVVPANVQVSLLTPATTEPLEAHGRLLRRGGRLAVAEGEVHQDGRAVCKATVTFALL